jgi:hypothetical protein
MVERQNEILGETLAIFSFKYASDGKSSTSLFKRWPLKLLSHFASFGIDPSWPQELQ